jgi:Flp pilus assembly protein TadD
LYAESEALREAGKLDESAEKLFELLKEDETYSLAHSALAVVLGRLDRHQEAVKHGVRVCELEPDDAFSFTALSVTYQRAGMIPEAEDAMAKARMMQGGH